MEYYSVQSNILNHLPQIRFDIGTQRSVTVLTTKLGRKIMKGCRSEKDMKIGGPINEEASDDEFMATGFGSQMSRTPKLSEDNHVKP